MHSIPLAQAFGRRSGGNVMEHLHLHRIPSSQVDPVDGRLALTMKVLAVAFFAALAASLWAAIGCPGIDLLGLPA